MKAQTILFDRALFTPEEARRWAREHGLRSSDVDADKPKIRVRQADPKTFRKGSFRTKTVRPGVKFVFGEPVDAPRRRAKKGAPGAGQDGKWRRVFRVGKATFYLEERAEARSRETGARVRPGWKRVG